MSDLIGYTIQNIEEIDITFPSWATSNGIKAVLEKLTRISLSEEKVTSMTMAGFNFQISGEIMLIGPKNIIFSIGMSKETARNLIAAMTGLDKINITDLDLVDGVSELTNVIGGNVKYRFSGENEDYKMLLPYTIFGDRHRIIHKSKGPIFIRKYNAENIEMIVSGYSLDPNS